MPEILNAISIAWSNTSTLEIVSTLFGLAYVILAARENNWCWPAAFIGTGTAIFLFWDVSLLMESALNFYYLLMALFGYWQWRYGGDNNVGLKITTFSHKQHLLTLSLILILSLISGYLLSKNTDAALPYLDSFTTWSAVITTWMVTQKILENWLYWIVIDICSIFLYLDRQLYLYALLFILYTIIAVFGYLKWKNTIERQSSSFQEL